jgi:hypothetical protein
MMHRCVLIIGVLAAAACSANQLAPADTSNQVDTITLGSLSRAALKYPTAIDMTTGLPVRTDQTSAFDFVYDVDSAGRHVFIPLAAIHTNGTNTLGSTTLPNPGFIVQTLTFDQLSVAPSDNYVTADTLALTAGEVLVARSRVACYLGVPQYGKIHVLSFDDSLHTVQLEILSDANCGYKSLAAGVPTS